MACGDVLSLEDLQTAKKHQIFEAEVITGRAGGVAGGADIDYATNQVTGQTQKTLPAVLRDAGFSPASFDFSTGGALGVNDRDKAVLWPISGGDGNYYVWKGVLPKTIPAASSPGSSGGVSSSAWAAVSEAALRSDLANNTDVGKGDALVAVRQPFTDAVARTQHSKNTDLVSVKDFGAVGDGVADDTAAIQAAINALTPAGGRLYLPKGAYKITAELSITNIPIEIFGDGMYATRIEQVTANTNGIHFVSNTTNNAPSTDNLLINCLHIHDISVNRGLNSGGIAVLASWGIMTSNSPQAIFERFRVYAKTDAGRTWAGGVDLRNCNGLRINTMQVIGNVLETPLTAADPYTLRYGIRLSNDSADSLGLISFFVDKLTVLAAGIGVSVFGWHEGFEIVNSELVQVAIGIQVLGNAVHKNPDFFYLNSHIEARVKCVSMSNVFKAKFTACDLFHSSAVGYAGSVIELNGCDAFSCTGTAVSMQSGTATYVVSGITSSTSYHGNVSGCTFLGLNNGIDINADSWNVGNNVFYQVTNPIRLYGNLHTLGVNKYTSCPNGVTYVGSGHQITPITYAASYVLNVTTAGVQQGFTVPIPAGVFRGKPEVVHVTPISGSTTLLFSCLYNYASASTTSTGVKIEVTGSASIPVGTYIFGITASSRQ